MNNTKVFKTTIIVNFLSLTLLLSGCSALVTRQDFSGLRANLADVQGQRVQAAQREEAYKKQRNQNYQDAFTKLSKSQQQSLLKEREITAGIKDNHAGAVMEGFGNVAGNIIEGDHHYCAP